MSTALEKYRQLQIERPEAFKDEGTLHIERNTDVIRKYEEDHPGITIGVVYDSPYHLMVVDLVYTVPGQYFTYERLLTKVKSGAVGILPIMNGKVILLHQYRHALRDFQYAIPRGFAEEGITPLDNAKKELGEELGGHIRSVEPLGLYAGDSGILGNAVFMYVCHIDDYVEKNGYEGIKDCISLTPTEIHRWIQEGKITDGFTLAAVCMYESL